MSMSLDIEETKNIPECKLNIYIRPISGFADSSSVGFDSNGRLVRVTERSTWVEVFTHGLSVEEELYKEFFSEKKNREKKKKTKTKEVQKKTIRQSVDYDGLEKILDKFAWKESKEKRYHPKRRISQRKRWKIMRSRVKKVYKPSKIMGEETRGSDKSEGEMDEEERVHMCECCGENSDTYQYDSVYSKRMSYLCADCARRECCLSCGWESGGSLCRYCRFEY